MRRSLITCGRSGDNSKIADFLILIATKLQLSLKNVANFKLLGGKNEQDAKRK